MMNKDQIIELNDFINKGMIDLINKEMINSKCSEKFLRKKKRSPIISIGDEQFLNKQKSMNQLISIDNKNLSNYSDHQLNRSNLLSTSMINKARSSQQKFTNYKHLIQQYQKYKVQRQTNDTFHNTKDKSYFYQKESLYSKNQPSTKTINQFNNKTFLNKTTLINQKPSNYQYYQITSNNYGTKTNNIKKYSSMKNLFQKTQLLSSPQPYQLPNRYQQKNYLQQQRYYNNFIKKQNNYKNTYKQQLRIEQKINKRQTSNNKIKKSQISNNKINKEHNVKSNKINKEHNLKSNNTIKQLQHKYMLLSQNYNKSLKHTKQINDLYEKQKQHLLKIKTQHFENQQLIDHLMDKVRNRDYLTGDQDNNRINDYQEGDQIVNRKRDTVDWMIQTQQQSNEININNSNINKDYNVIIHIEQRNNKLNNYLQVPHYLQVPQPFQQQYQNMRSYVQTYQQLQSQDNQQYSNSIKQDDSNSITQLKRDLFNVKSMIHQHMNSIQKGQYQNNNKNHNHSAFQTEKLSNYCDSRVDNKNNNKNVKKQKIQLYNDNEIKDTQKSQHILLKQYSTKQQQIRPNRYRFQPSISINL